MTRSMILFAVLLAFGLISTLAAAAEDAEAGQRVFNQCRACHTINEGGRAAVGPNLHGIVGRKAGAFAGFRYSAPMREKADAGLTWNEESLRAYIRNPKEVVPAGSMSFPGLKNDQQLDDLVAYLKTQS